RQKSTSSSQDQVQFLKNRVVGIKLELPALFQVTNTSRPSLRTSVESRSGAGSFEDDVHDVRVGHLQNRRIAFESNARRSGARGSDDSILARSPQLRSLLPLAPSGDQGKTT